MLYYEKKLKRQGFKFIVGVDEAGRGPLAGPVVAAAVTLTDMHFKNRIDDSKKLTSKERENACLEIINKSIFGIGIISEKIIDRVNILQATRMAMKEAVLSLFKKMKSKERNYIYLLVDGDIRIDIGFSQRGIIKGDAKSKSIASASILAKVTRDRLMREYDLVYPEYGFIQHKGYPTRLHKLAIKKFGPSEIHRLTFRSV